VYIIRPLVLISISIAFVGVALPQLAKFAVVLALTIAVAFTLANLIRAVPGVKRVLRGGPDFASSQYDMR